MRLSFDGLAVRPQTLYVKRFLRGVYAKLDEDGGRTVLPLAPIESPFERGCADSSLLSFLIVSKFCGTLQTDGYAGCNAACQGLGLARAGCHAHARRKFKDAESYYPKSGSIWNCMPRCSTWKRSGRGRA